MTEEPGIVYFEDGEDGRLLFKNELGEVFVVDKIICGEKLAQEDL